MATCCTVATGFSEASCEQELGSDEEVPFTNLSLLYAGLNSTNVTLDQAKAQQCIDGMGALACGENQASQLDALLLICSAALKPVLGPGDGPCQSSFDCPSGTFCGPIVTLDSDYVPQVAPGATCLPVGAVGDACLDDGYSSDCASQGNLGAGVFCGPTPGDAGALTCQSAFGTGAACLTAENQQCLSGVCADQAPPAQAYVCSDAASSEVVLSDSVCTGF